MSVKMLLPLCFIPVPGVVAAFVEFTENFPLQLTTIPDYWEDTCIGRLRMNGRAQPNFSVALWNMYDRVNANLPTTNNYLGWHHAFQNTVDCHHPAVYKLIGHFHVAIQIERHQAGIQRTGASKSKYI